MIKSLAPFAIVALLGMTLPAFLPDMKPNELAAFPKASLLAITPLTGDCVAEVGPNFDSACLRLR